MKNNVNSKQVLKKIKFYNSFQKMGVSLTDFDVH